MRDLLYGVSGTALQVLHQHRMWLLRQVHGMVSTPQPDIIDIAEQTFMSIKMNHTTRMSDLVVVQQRLHREGYTHVLEDLYGRMNPDYLINRGPISGHFVMTMQPKRQRRSREPCMIKVTVMVKPIDGMTTNYTMDVASGVFVFEIFNSIPIMPVIHYENILDSEGNKWRADDRIWRPVTFAEYDFHKDLRGSGILVDAGTGDASLDWLGRHLVQMMEGFNNTWIPARHLTQLVVDDTDQFFATLAGGSSPWYLERGCCSSKSLDPIGIFGGGRHLGGLSLGWTSTGKQRAHPSVHRESQEGFGTADVYLGIWLLDLAGRTEHLRSSCHTSPGTSSESMDLGRHAR